MWFIKHKVAGKVMSAVTKRVEINILVKTVKNVRELLDVNVYPKNEFFFPSEIVEEHLKCTVYPILFHNYNFKIAQYNKIKS